jgi:DNA polymerase III subunit beta
MAVEMLQETKCITLAIDARLLLSVVKRIVGITPRSSAMPSLRCVWIKPEAGFVRFVGTDLETEMIVDVPMSSVSGPGAMIDARLLAQLLESMRGELNIQFMDGRMIIMDALRTIELHSSVDADELPVGNWFPEGYTSVDWLLPALPALLRTVSHDESRATLTAVFLGSDCLVTTDTHRLTVRYLDPAEQIPGWMDVLVYARVLSKLRALLGVDGTSPVDVAVSPNRTRIAFRSTTSTVITRLHEGDYVNWKRVVPTVDQGWKWMVNSSELIGQLRSILPIAMQDGGRVALTREGDVLGVTAESPTVGRMTVRHGLLGHRCQDGYEETRVGAHAQYVIDALSVFPPQTPVVISMTGEVSPIVFTSDQYPQRLAIVMPMQLR